MSLALNPDMSRAIQVAYPRLAASGTPSRCVISWASPPSPTCRLLHDGSQMCSATAPATSSVRFCSSVRLHGGIGVVSPVVTLISLCDCMPSVNRYKLCPASSMERNMLIRHCAPPPRC
jgi:hypothetical protein